MWKNHFVNFKELFHCILFLWHLILVLIRSQNSKDSSCKIYRLDLQWVQLVTKVSGLILVCTPKPVWHKGIVQVVLLVCGWKWLNGKLQMELSHYTHTQEAGDFIHGVILVTLGMTFTNISLILLCSWSALLAVSNENLFRFFPIMCAQIWGGMSYWFLNV